MFPIICFSQKGMTTVGLQYKPIFSASFLGTGKIVNDTAGVHVETNLSSGFSAGMIVRHNFTGLIAFETGINYIKRTYSLNFSEPGYEEKSKFRIVGYEVPIVFMIYAQLGEKIYINGSMGPVIDLFVSDIETFGESFNHFAYRNHTFMPAISANLGCEYRTEKSGIIYLGASFQRPFEFIYVSNYEYYRNNKSILRSNELSGSYLTVDIRYFFPENDKKRKANSTDD
jgi:hypothetical protein